MFAPQKVAMQIKQIVRHPTLIRSRSDSSENQLKIKAINSLPNQRIFINLRCSIIFWILLSNILAQSQSESPPRLMNELK